MGKKKRKKALIIIIIFFALAGTAAGVTYKVFEAETCLLYTSPSPRD